MNSVESVGVDSSSEELPEDRDREVLICSSCGGPFYHDESGVECMCSDEPGVPIPERLSCHRCKESVAFNEELDADPMDCSCPSESKPDSYRIMSKTESINRAAEFL